MPTSIPIATRHTEPATTPGAVRAVCPICRRPLGSDGTCTNPICFNRVTAPASGPDRLDLADVFLREHSTLLRYAYRLTGSHDAAEDVVQEAYLNALTKKDKYRPGTNAGAWLMVMVRYAAMEYRRGAHRLILVDHLEETLPDETPEAGAGTCLGDPDVAAVVNEALSTLEPRYAEVLRRRVLDGMSPQAIAVAMGIRAATVYEYARVALINLRKSGPVLAGLAGAR